MSFWMELRCDLHLPGCYSDKNNGPMESARNTRAAVLVTARILLAEGGKHGWKKLQRGVACPSCVKKEKR